MVAGGLLLPRPNHAEAVRRPRPQSARHIQHFNRQYDTSIRIRIGLCTGPVVAGVIGRGRFAYDLWSETVNLACRLETTGEAGRIQIAASTRERLQQIFGLKKRDTLAVGVPDGLPTYWLGRRTSVVSTPAG